MMHDPIEPDKWHPVGCACADCDRRPWHQQLTYLDLASLWSIVGLGVALVLIEALHLVAGLPGPSIIFGARP